MSIVVKDIEAAIKRFETPFNLKVYDRRESKQFGFKNAILPLNRGHIELLQPTDPSSAVARFLEAHGEGVYLVGFDVEDVASRAKELQEKGTKVTLAQSGAVAWVHPEEAHGVFVEMRRPAQYV